MALLPIVANAYDAKTDGIYYNFSEDEAWVTYEQSIYNGAYGTSSYSYVSDYTGSVVIPSTVTYNRKTYSVTSIGGQAFYG